MRDLHTRTRRVTTAIRLLGFIVALTGCPSQGNGGHDTPGFAIDATADSSGTLRWETVEGADHYIVVAFNETGVRYWQLTATSMRRTDLDANTKLDNEANWFVYAADNDGEPIAVSNIGGLASP